MSESLIYPLFFLMLCLACSGQTRKLALAGAVGGVLFAVKPGQIVTPIVLTAVTAISTMRRSRREGLRQFAAGLLPLALTSAALLLLNMYVINPGTTAFSMYDVQISSAENIQTGEFLRALALSPYTFVMAAGILPLLIPVMHSAKYSREQRILLYSALISAAVLMLGSARVINRIESEGHTVHMRYTAMFIPVFLMLLAAAPEDTKIRGKGLGFYVFAPCAWSPSSSSAMTED